MICPTCKGDGTVARDLGTIAEGDHVKRFVSSAFAKELCAPCGGSGQVKDVIDPAKVREENPSAFGLFVDPCQTVDPDYSPRCLSPGEARFKLWGCVRNEPLEVMLENMRHHHEKIEEARERVRRWFVESR